MPPTISHLDPDPPAAPVQNSRAAPRRLRALIGGACWAYLVLAVSLWLLLRGAGDRWWVATVVLFGPRWLALLPLAVLLPAALAARRRALGTLLVAALIVLFPVAGLCIPWRQAVAPRAAAGAFGLRVMTCNAHRLALDPVALAELIQTTRPDVVALQEWTAKHDRIVVDNEKWHVLRDGELCILSRHPIRRVEDVAESANWKSLGIAGAAVHYEIDAPQRNINFFNVHLASPHKQFEAVLGGSPEGPARVERNSSNRRRQSDALARCSVRAGGPVLIAGDFNIPAESGIFRAAWRGLDDAFSTAGWGLGHTYHARWTAVRIDHILSGDGWSCRRCWVGPDVGSPHRPLIAELDWIGRRDDPTAPAFSVSD